MNEVGLRANFQEKLDEAIGLPVKPRAEYVAQASKEIRSQTQALSAFVNSLQPQPNSE